MKIILLIGLLAVSLAGCSELSERQKASYQDYGVSGSLYAKMHARQRLDQADIVELSDHHVRSSEIMAYLAYSNTEIPLNDEDARQLARQKVSTDVITYLREKPNNTGGLLSVFSSWDLE